MSARRRKVIEPQALDRVVVPQALDRVVVPALPHLRYLALTGLSLASPTYDKTDCLLPQSCRCFFKRALQNRQTQVKKKTFVWLNDSEDCFILLPDSVAATQALH